MLQPFCWNSQTVLGSSIWLLAQTCPLLVSSVMTCSFSFLRSVPRLSIQSPLSLSSLFHTPTPAIAFPLHDSQTLFNTATSSREPGNIGKERLPSQLLSVVRTEPHLQRINFGRRGRGSGWRVQGRVVKLIGSNKMINRAGRMGRQEERQGAGVDQQMG